MVRTRNRQSRSPRRGFTLVELLVVVAVIALLISMLLPTLSKARASALDLQCASSERQLGIAFQTYNNDNQQPQFLDINRPFSPSNPNMVRQRWIAVKTLEPYLEYNKQAFVCPLARGNLSVLDPDVAEQYDEGAIVMAKDANNDGKINYFDDYVTEYWVADYPLAINAATGERSGVSNQPFTKVKYPQGVVIFADAIDWIPRHHGKINLLFLDLRVEFMDRATYMGPDSHHSSTPFYCWGHKYF